MKQLRELWIGLIQARARPNSNALGAAKGAYFNIVTWASSAEEFKRKAALLCDNLGLFIEDIEDEMPIRREGESSILHDDLQELIEQAENDPNAILYGTFHTWHKEDRM